ncbi:hypothetical protein D3C79_49500 [compost metagenome]
MRIDAADLGVLMEKLLDHCVERGAEGVYISVKSTSEIKSPLENRFFYYTLVNDMGGNGDCGVFIGEEKDNTFTDHVPFMVIYGNRETNGLNVDNLTDEKIEESWVKILLINLMVYLSGTIPADQVRVWTTTELQEAAVPTNKTLH